MRLAVMPERLPSGDAQVALVPITDGIQLGNHDIEQGIVLDDDIQVYDGFGGQARHSGAADMLNSQSQIARGVMNLGFDIDKVLCPFFAVGLNDDVLCDHDHSPL